MKLEFGCVYNFEQKKCYALLVHKETDKETFLFFPWNNAYKSFSPDATFNQFGEINVLLNPQRSPAYHPKTIKQLTNVALILQEKADDYLTKDFAGLKRWIEEIEQEALKIPANETTSDNTISEIIALKDQICQVLQGISPENAQSVIFYYFLEKCSNGRLNDKKEPLTFVASILALLELGVTVAEIIASSLPLKFLVQNSVSMSVVEDAYHTLKLLLDHESIADETKDNIQHYLTAIQAQGMSFEGRQTLLFRLNGQGISSDTAMQTIHNYSNALIAHSPVLDSSLKKDLAKLYCMDFENNSSNKDTDYLFMLAQKCSINELPEAKIYQQWVAKIVVTVDNFLLLSIVLEEPALSSHAPSIIKKIIDFYYHHSDNLKTFFINNPLSEKLVPDNHQETFSTVCQQKKETLYPQLVNLVPQTKQLSEDDFINIKDAHQKGWKFLKMLDKSIVYQNPEAGIYPPDSHALNTLILMNTPNEYLLPNFDKLFEKFDQDYPSDTQKIQVRLKTLMHTSFNDENKLNKIFQVLIEQFSLDTIIAETLKMNSSAINSSALTTLISHLLSDTRIDFHTRIKPLLKIQDKYGNTPLHDLASTNPSEFVQLISQFLSNTRIDFKKSIKPLLQIQNEDSSTLLHRLAYKNSSEFVNLISQLLSDTRIDFHTRIKPLLEIQEGNGYTSLHRLVCTSPSELVNLISHLLSDTRIDFHTRIKPLLEIQDNRGNTPLHYLVCTSPSEFVNLISQFLSNQNIHFDTRIKPLLEIKDKDGYTSLNYLVYKNPSEFVNLISQFLSNQTINFETSIKPLLEIQNTYGKPPLHYLVYKNPSEFLKLISQLLSNQNIHFDTRIKPLLEIQNTYKKPPLHYLAYENPSEFVNLISQLLSNSSIDFHTGIKPLLKIRDKYGDTPLHDLAKTNPSEFLKLISSLLSDTRIDFDTGIKPLLQMHRGLTVFNVLSNSVQFKKFTLSTPENTLPENLTISPTQLKNILNIYEETRSRRGCYSFFQISGSQEIAKLKKLLKNSTDTITWGEIEPIISKYKPNSNAIGTPVVLQLLFNVFNEAQKIQPQLILNTKIFQL